MATPQPKSSWFRGFTNPFVRKPTEEEEKKGLKSPLNKRNIALASLGAVGSAYAAKKMYKRHKKRKLSKTSKIRGRKSRSFGKRKVTKKGSRRSKKGAKRH